MALEESEHSFYSVAILFFAAKLFAELFHKLKLPCIIKNELVIVRYVYINEESVCSAMHSTSKTKQDNSCLRQFYLIDNK